MLKQIIEIIDTKNSWGKNQLIETLEPEISKYIDIRRSNMDLIKYSIITKSLSNFADYINSKSSHGKVELKLALLDLIAKEYSKE